MLATIMSDTIKLLRGERSHEGESQKQKKKIKYGI